MLTPNEHLTGSTHQKREIYDRLAGFRADPRRTLRLAERYPHLTFVTLDAVVGALSGQDLDAFGAGVELARDRLADFGQTTLLPLERVFVAVSAATPEHGGFHHRLLPYRAPDDIQAPGYRYVQAAAVISRYGDLHTTAPPVPSTPGIIGLDLLHAYIHDTFHYLTYRSYRLGANGIHRNQHGINFRRESGQTYSARDPQGSASTRNLGIVMEGAFDREAAAIAGAAAQAVGCTTAAGGIDAVALQNAVGARTPTADDEPYLASMNGYVALVTEPYAAFLADVGGPETTELHDLIIRATLDGDLGPIQVWLDQRYGPGEFAALFRNGAYAAIGA